MWQIKEETKTEILSTHTYQKPLKKAWKQLFELLGTNEKFQIIFAHTVLTRWWKFRVKGFGLSEDAKVFFGISGPYQSILEGVPYLFFFIFILKKGHFQGILAIFC